MSRCKNYIFDLYGTLADILTDETGRRLWQASAWWYGEHGEKYTPTELKSAYLRLCKKEQTSVPDPLYEIELRRVFASLFAEKGVEADERMVGETAVFFRVTSLKKLRLYPWVAPVFELIRRGGGRIFLLSNAQSCFTEPELIQLGIDGAFDGIAISSDVGYKKPDPRIMRSLIERFGLDPEECLMTGNDRTTDVAIADLFGMDSLYIRTETSCEVPGAPLGKTELLDGDYSKLPRLMGLL